MKEKTMNGVQTLTAILGIAFIVGSGWCFKVWLKAQSGNKQNECDAMRSEQETERFRILANLADQNIQLTDRKAALEPGHRQ